ncbi:MAG: glutamate--tRNA ligase [Deltaproteobacteria bacterium]|nr:MAG: glutamate--tRNA ligase [Deltaproteobacteria bacterium]
MTVRTRFAPSPTGSLHVGGARTALYCLLHARREGGQFVLRIEDTDQARSTEESAKGIVDDLKWLGLLWDEGPEVGGDFGPYFQSQRLDIYNRYLDQLLAEGKAYEAWESREELQAMRDAAQAAKRDFVFRHPGYADEDVARYKAEGRTPVVRLRAPSHDLVVHDVVLGDVVMPAEKLEDVVVRKADGFPTYHFAVVVDDHHMGITQVLRGQEHLMNTPKHLAIYEALGWEPPKYGHMPLIFSMDGSKMSKRDKAKTARAAARDASKARGAKDHAWLAEATGVDAAELQQFMKKKNDGVALAEAIAKHLAVPLPMIDVTDFKKGGYLPEALNNFLALLGWSPGDDREVMTLAEMQELFTVDRIGKTNAKFDTTKLEWLNGETIRRSTLDRLVEAHDDYLGWTESPLAGLSAAQRRDLLEMYQARIKTFADLDVQASFFVTAPTAYDDKGAAKWLLKGEPTGLAHLAATRSAIAECVWTVDGIEEAVKSLAEAREVGMGKLAQPLRMALTGTASSPGLGQTVAFFARDEVLARIDACLAHFA